jgi:sugar lactone lactonase YvrE
MGTAPISCVTWLRRTGTAVLALGLVPGAMLAGTGQAASAQAAGGAQPGGHREAGPAVAGTISTVAGGVGGPGLATRVPLATWLPAPDTPVGEPCSVVFGHGHLYIGDDMIRAVNPGTDYLTTIAGNGGASSPLGDGGPATQTALQACGIALDKAGNVVLADTGTQRIRVVATRPGTFYGQAMTKGDIYTVAGDGADQYGRSGVPATQTALWSPRAVAVDSHGNLLIAVSGANSRGHFAGFGASVRVVAAATGRFYGRQMTAGDIYTIAGFQHGVTFSGDGGAATAAGLGTGIGGVGVDHSGNVLIGGSADRVRVVAEHTGTYYGQAMTKGDIYTVAGDGTLGYSGDGGPGTAADLFGPQGVAADPAGNLLIADSFNERVRVVAGSTGTFYGQAMTAGDIYTIAGDGQGGASGDGGPATSAAVGAPNGVAVDASGNVLIAGGGRVRMVAETSGTFYGKPMTPGDIYTIAGNSADLYSGDGGPATRAELNLNGGNPSFNGTVAVDGSGNLVISDSFNSRIRVAAAASGTFYGVPMTAGNIYTVAGTGATGFSGDGGPARDAKLFDPHGVTVDPSGNLVIADSTNGRVRVVAASTGTFYGQPMTAGDIYTVAGGGSSGADGVPATQADLISPDGMAVDSHGNLLIAAGYTVKIRVVAGSTGTFYGQAMTAGDIYTIAGNGTQGYSGDGGPATSAQLGFPTGVAVDGAGNVVINDFGNSAIRIVAGSTGTFYGRAMTAGDIYTLAGNGHAGFAGDGGPAAGSQLDDPNAVAVDNAGNVVIADAGNNRVRVVAATSGTFYGLPMTAGDIYTVAGTGTAGLSGDGGPGTSAELSWPSSVASDGGNLVIADSLNERVRLLSGS